MLIPKDIVFHIFHFSLKMKDYNPQLPYVNTQFYSDYKEYLRTRTKWISNQSVEEMGPDHK
jgi:hypothetical protein